MLEARPLRLQRKPASVAEIVRYSLALAGKQLQHSRVQTELHLPEEPVVILASQDRLAQVFLNLIFNAIEAMPDGGILAISARRAGPEAEITVEDSGQGIPPGVLPMVFEPFFTTRPDGPGLGLAISHNIVEQHGGTIEAANGAHGGAVMTIRLPLAPGE